VTRYIETFFRHKVLLLTPLVITLVLSGLYVKSQPTTYSTSAKIWQDNQLPGPGYLDPTGNGGTPPANSAQTLFGQLLSTQDFLVKAALRGPAAGWIRSQPDPTAAANQVAATLGSSVSAMASGPQILGVSLTSRDPVNAQKELSAVVDEYFDYVKTLRSAREQAMVDYYKPRLDAASAALQEAQAAQFSYVQSHPLAGGSAGTPDPEYGALSAAVLAAQTQYNSVEQNYTTADQALTTEQAQVSSHVIDAPGAPLASSKKKAAVFAGGAGIFFGLLVGLLGLIALTAADTAARRREDVETTTGDLQVVATIAEFPRERERTQEARSR
jgi:uncharacterized protein involved in exopolysaccharide biosynthesis